MSKKVFVYGWYDKNNIGDEAFKVSFRLLWPQTTFIFDNYIPDDINTYDALFVGGGSFLDQHIKSMNKVTIPIGFIGIGLGTKIEENNLSALKRAKIVVVRDQTSGKYFPTSYIASDLVFVQPELQITTKQKQIVVLANDFLSPKCQATAWHDTSFHWFAHELGQILDNYVRQGYKILFYPMCVGDVDDRRASAHIVSKMYYKNQVDWILNRDSIDFNTLIASSELIITQRLHGAIFSSLYNSRYVLICNHQKMYGLLEELQSDTGVDYYGFSANKFYASVKGNGNRNIDYIKQKKEQWKCISAIVEKIFCL